MPTAAFLCPCICPTSTPRRREAGPREVLVFGLVPFMRRNSSMLWLGTGVPDNAFEVCGDLGRRYGPKLGVRTLDSLHVACALELKTQRFLTFDDRKRKLAKAAGLDLR